MKKKNWLIAFLMILGICSCSSDKEPMMLPPEFSDVASLDVTRVSATVTGLVWTIGDGVVKTCGVAYSTMPDLSHKVMVEAEQISDISVTLEGLSPGTTYYYVLYASSGFSTAYSEPVCSFRTLEYFVPTVGECKVKVLSTQSVMLSCSILDDGGMETVKVGFAYRMADNPGSWQEVEAKLNGNSFELELSDLAARGNYVFYAFAVNASGKGQSIEVSQILNPSSIVDIGDMTEGGILE